MNEIPINRTDKDFKLGMPDQECYVQLPPALGGALPGERFRATVKNGTYLEAENGQIMDLVGCGENHMLVIGAGMVGRRAYISWPEPSTEDS